VIRRYTLPEMAAIWSDQARFEHILRVELAVARAQAARGLIPAQALSAMETRATIDVERIAEIERARPTTTSSPSSARSRSRSDRRGDISTSA